MICRWKFWWWRQQIKIARGRLEWFAVAEHSVVNYEMEMQEEEVVVVAEKMKVVMEEMVAVKNYCYY